MQEFLCSRKLLTGGWISFDKQKICFRPLERLLPPIGKPKMSPSRAEKIFLGINIF